MQHEASRYYVTTGLYYGST